LAQTLRYLLTSKTEGKYEADLKNCKQAQQVPVDRLKLTPEDTGRVSGNQRQTGDIALLEY
jgi:hypothetical protein